MIICDYRDGSTREGIVMGTVDRKVAEEEQTSSPPTGSSRTT
jgi:hypothetical protein